MYTLETREDTIRIPAEYIRRGRRLEDHIDELAHDAFECRFDENENFTLLTFDHEAVGRGKIIHGDGAVFWKSFRYLILPSFALAVSIIAWNARLTRSAMLEVLDSEYIKLARAKGVSNRVVVWKHALRNALIQPLTIATLLLAGFMDGAVLVEVIFAWPGVGRVAVEAVNQNDFMLITGTVFIFTALYLVMSLVADLLYTVVDPRIRYA